MGGTRLLVVPEVCARSNIVGLLSWGGGSRCRNLKSEYCALGLDIMSLDSAVLLWYYSMCAYRDCKVSGVSFGEKSVY